MAISDYFLRLLRLFVAMGSSIRSPQSDQTGCRFSTREATRIAIQ